MPVILSEDRELTSTQVQSLSSADALAAFFTHLGYPGDTRLAMTAEALGLASDLARNIKRMERLASVEQGALEIYLFELKSVTVSNTRALARAFRDRAGDYLLVLTDDYDRLDFVLLERVLPESNRQGIIRRGLTRRPRVLTVDRRNPGQVALRVLRRFTFTEFDSEGEPDPYAQYDKLQSAYVVAEWSEPLFNNRALFSDYYLNQRLPTLPEWNDPARNQAFHTIRGLLANARRRFAGQPGSLVRQGLIQPLLEALGFQVESPLASPAGDTVPDFRLFVKDEGRERKAENFALPPAAFILAYPWGRSLDGKDETRDSERPEENPSAQAVSLLEGGAAPWALVTNGKLWRLYSAQAHSRATNYYELDLEETLASPAPAEAFRYFYLFFRAAAFAPIERSIGGESRVLGFLDWLMEESTAYAQELGERLKDRVFEEIFPHLAEGFIQGLGGPETLLELPEAEREAKLDEVFHGTLTFLYRLLFLLYAESRDLLPVREVRGYYQISLQQLKEEIAAQAKTLADQASGHLKQAYAAGANDTTLYDRLLALFRVIDQGDPTRNVPIYNGGLFMTEPPQPAPAEGEQNLEVRTARFLRQHKLPDRYLALGLDLLARDLDAKRGDLVFIDYKSLGVRQLGSIYEGLLEFKVRVAATEMAVIKGKKTEEIIPHAEAKRQKLAVKRLLPRGAVYLENDRRERKATGSYYTPDYIVKYIVQHTVGPVLDEKFEMLRPRLQQMEKRFRETVQRKQTIEKVTPDKPALLSDVAGNLLRDLFDLKVLDPAMGSGHFLVEAVDYITDRLVRFLEGFPFLSYFFEGMRRGILAEMERQAVTIDPARLTDVTLLKRHVLKRCIYGVDLNPMAVELAKVSLWLDCFTLGAPLSFLDHHLRRGNSLMGASARQAEEEMAGPAAGGQLTFLTGPFVGLLRAAEIMRGISLLTDVTMAEVQQSEGLFKEFDRAARPYKQLLDVYVARHFGVKRADEFLQLYGVDALTTNPAKLTEAHRLMLTEVLRLYEDKHFFHWDLEFPEVFIDLDRADWKQNGGFDAVVGNPPYGLTMSLPWFLDLYNDLFVYFWQRGINLNRIGGFLALITPTAWLTGVNYKQLRENLLNNTQVISIIGLPYDIFGDAYIDTCVAVAKVGGSTIELVLVKQMGKHDDARDIDDLELDNIDSQLWKNGPYKKFVLIPAVAQLQRFQNSPAFMKLGEIVLVERGVQPYSRQKHTNDQIKRDFLRFLGTPSENLQSLYFPELLGEELSRYRIEPTKQSWLKYSDELASKRDEKFFTKQRIVLRRLLSRRRELMAAFTDDKLITTDNILNILITSEETSEGFVTALLNSKLLAWLYTNTSTMSVKDDFPQVTYEELKNLPLRCVNFTTPTAERTEQLARLISQYEQEQDTALLAAVETLLPQDEAGNFLAFAPGATGTEEKSDVVHDLLAHLAQQMIDLNQQKQTEQKRFLGWLETSLKISPDNKGSTGLNILTGKTKILGYLGDYQKGEPETPWGEIEDVLFKNKGRLGVSLSETRLLARLRSEYEKSLDTLRPIKAQLARTDWLIDQIVYRLYGLTEEEIAVVEGKDEKKTRALKQPSLSPGRPRSIARESDPRVLAQVIETLGQSGPATSFQLAAYLNERNLKLEPDKAETIQREFQFLGWLKSETNQWILTEQGQALATLHPTMHVEAFARQLALANEQYNEQVITHLLRRMGQLNPAGQGAVILPQPPLEAAPESLVELEAWLIKQFPRWSQGLQQQMAGFVVGSETFEPVAEAIVTALTGRWPQMKSGERRRRLLELITERFIDLMFGHIITPSDVEIWQHRLDWAGLTHTARQLPGLAGQVWFPVGAFRAEGGDDFSPIVELVSQGQTFYCHTPAGPKFQARFSDTLYEGYQQQQRQERVEYVSLLAVRDWVCYRLRISHAIFERTLQEIFLEALRGELKFTMALEVDITPAERSRLGSARPVMIDNIPRYIMAMRVK